MKLLYNKRNENFTNISLSAHYPSLFFTLLDTDEAEPIEVPSEEHYIIYASYYSVSSYLYHAYRNTGKPQVDGYLPDEMYVDLKAKKATLIIANDADTVPVNKLLAMLSAFYEFGIPKKSLIYADSNPKIEKSLEKHGYQAFYYNWIEELFEVSQTTIDQISESINSLVLRDKKFLFFGGKPRPFRVEFLKKCIDSVPNFEQNSFISIGSNHIVGKRSLDLEDNWISKTPITSEDKKTIKDFVTPWDITYNKIYSDFHNNSYFNLVTSTQYYYEGYRMSVNEKQFKPIVAMQPFIMVTEPEMLRFLKESGYKTFSNWIDESYDTTLCDTERMNKVVAEITKLNTLTNSELSAMLKDMLPVLQHNAELYMHTSKKNNVKTNLVYNVKRFIDK